MNFHSGEIKMRGGFEFVEGNKIFLMKTIRSHMVTVVFIIIKVAHFKTVLS